MKAAEPTPRHYYAERLYTSAHSAKHNGGGTGEAAMRGLGCRVSSSRVTAACTACETSSTSLPYWRHEHSPDRPCRGRPGVSHFPPKCGLRGRTGRQRDAADLPVTRGARCRRTY